MSNFCKKAIGTNNNIIGQWQWKYSIGGIAVQTITASDTHVILTFQQISTYTLSENGTIQSNDQFFITYDSTYKKLYISSILHPASYGLGQMEQLFLFKIIN